MSYDSCFTCDSYFDGWPSECGLVPTPPLVNRNHVKQKNMQTLNHDDLTPENLNELNDLAGSAKSPQVRELLTDLSASLRRGDDIIRTQKNESLTTSEAAKFLGMSRTHLYKLMDKDEIPSFSVGRHRRIYMRDILEFENQRHRDRTELAERFAQGHQGSATADGEIADLL